MKINKKLTILVLFCSLLLIFQNCGDGFDAASTTGAAIDLGSELEDTSAPPLSQGIEVVGVPVDVSSELNLEILIGWINPLQASDLICYLDDVDLGVCPSTLSLSNLSEGEHTLRIVSPDGRIPEYRAVWVTDLPDLGLVVNAPAAVNPLENMDLVYTINNDQDLDVVVTCSFDGAPLNNCASPISLTNLAEGNHSLILNLIQLSG